MQLKASRYRFMATVATFVTGPMRRTTVALFGLLSRKGGWARFTISVGSVERTNLEVVDTVCAVLDVLLPDWLYRPHGQLTNFVKDRPGHDRRSNIDARKSRRELCWEPTEDFELGIRRAMKAAFQQRRVVRTRSGWTQPTPATWAWLTAAGGIR
jgi:dTDP-D-glucose 4,6-dehydratase